VQIAPQFRSISRSGEGRIAELVTLAATKKAGESASEMCGLFADDPSATIQKQGERS
jgi:hypothetical protein